MVLLWYRFIQNLSSDSKVITTGFKPATFLGFQTLQVSNLMRTGVCSSQLTPGGFLPTQ